MSVPDPSSGEIMRRVDDVVTRLEGALQRIEGVRDWAERSYVPREVWAEGRRTDQEAIKAVAGDVEDLKTEAKSRTSFRNQVLVVMYGSLFTGVLSVAGFVGLVLLGKR